MKNLIFHRATIGGFDVTAIMSADGPYVRVSQGVVDQGVALGYCTSLAVLDTDGRESLWLVKYHEEQRAEFKDLDLSHLPALKREFGLLPRSSGDAERVDAFYASVAGQNLVRWVADNPRLAKQYAAMNTYVGNWYGWARAQAQQTAAA